MTFISYAQNYEDVMLRRALREVDSGYYIDVGANDPESDSVTKAFYDMGWRGINIEPVPYWFDKLQKYRPEDINLQVATSDKPGKLTFFDVVGTGLSTLSEGIAKKHAIESGYQVRSYIVPAKTLTDICDENKVNEIHFLKIDVEGGEAATLRGFDLSKFRPWIMLVEATLPNTQVLDYLQWESELINNGYHFVYFDGLNRFYVANEHAGLDDGFLAPPNFFDYFIRHSEALLQERVSFLEHKYNQMESVLRDKESLCKKLASDLESRAQQEKALKENLNLVEQQRNTLEPMVQVKEQERLQLAAMLNGVTNSHSWRLMRPFRYAVYLLKKLLSVGMVMAMSVKLFLKSLPKRTLHAVLHMISRYPGMKSWIADQMKRFPYLERKLRRIVGAPPKTNIAVAVTLSSSTEVERIYRELKCEIDRHAKTEHKI